jgi:hypothetical protein
MNIIFFLPHNGITIADLLIFLFSYIHDNFEFSWNYCYNNNNKKKKKKKNKINYLIFYFVCKFFVVSSYVHVL